MTDMKVTYEQFKDQVIERWEDGEVNELVEEGLIKVDSSYSDAVHYDIISEEEFNKLQSPVIDREELIHALKSLDIEKDDTWSDNLTIVLATYFSEHEDRPEDDVEDSDFGWGQWVMNETNRTFEHLADQLINKIKFN